MGKPDVISDDIVITPGKWLEAEKMYRVTPYASVKIPPELHAGEKGEVMTISENLTMCKVLVSTGARIRSEYISVEVLKQLNPGLTVETPPYRVPASLKTVGLSAAVVAALVLIVSACVWSAMRSKEKNDNDKDDSKQKIEKKVGALLRDNFRDHAGLDGRADLQADAFADAHRFTV